MFGTQPLTKPLAGVLFHRSIGFADWTQTEVVGPTDHDPIECRYYRGIIQQGFVLPGLRADCRADTLYPLLRRNGTDLGAACFRRIAATECIPQKVELLFW